MTLHALLAAAALLAVAPSAEPELRVVDRPIEPDEVPPGSREDQLLYRSLRNGTAELRKLANDGGRVLWEASYAKLNLDELAKGAKPDEAARVEVLRAKLVPVARSAIQAMPVSGVFGCRYAAMYLEDSMVAAATPQDAGTEAAKRLPAMREEARRCDGQTAEALARLRPALGALRACLDEIGPEIRERRAARGLPPEALPPSAPPAAVDGAPAPIPAATTSR